jgi:hypothetical protein
VPLQNRVDPFGELIATAGRGTMFGNRGGRFHRDDRTLGARRWASRQWICCVLSFKGRQRDVWGRYYTELFFLDEVTALAAGHRPCFECRRAAANSFAEKWAQQKGSGFPYVDEMDRVLQAERVNGRAKRTHAMPFGGLPDGAVVAIGGAPYALRGAQLLRWSERGYTEQIARPHGSATVLTPPSIVEVLRAGYRPQWHPSASDITPHIPAA